MTSRIKRLRLRSFRSFVDADITFHNDTGPNSLVGPNSSGKSNVLRALTILFARTFDSENIVSDDFHADSQMFHLEAFVSGHSEPIHATAQRSHTPPHTLTRSCPRWFSSDVFLVPAFLVPVAPDPLHKPISHSTFQESLRPYWPPQIDLQARLTDELRDLCDTRSITVHLDGRDGLYSVSIDDGIRTGIGSKGAGLQHLTMLAAAIGTLGAATNLPELLVLGVEEPELFLPPHLCHKVNRALRRASGRAHVLYTTHSPWLIDPTVPESLVRTTRAAQTGSLVTTYVKGGAASHVDIIGRSGPNVHKAFFAQHSVLVEGPQDSAILCAAGRKAKLFAVDPEEAGCLLIQARGKAELAQLMRTFNYYRLYYTMLWEQDHEPPDSGLNKSINALLQAGLADKTCLNFVPLPGTLESHLANFDPQLHPYGGRLKIHMKGESVVDALMLDHAMAELAMAVAAKLFRPSS